MTKRLSPDQRKPPRTKRSGSGGKHTYVPPRWRFDDILVGLGPDSAIVHKVTKRGYPKIPRSTIAGWRLRNSIPTFWVPLFIQMALDEKLIRRIEDMHVPS